MTNLNKSKHYRGEKIKGEFKLTILPEDPLSLVTDLTGTTFQFILKKKLNDLDSQSLANLTLGQGLSIISSTPTEFKVEYLIPGNATSNLVGTERQPIVEIYYEINATYLGETYSDVLEIGSIKIDTNRVKQTLP